MKNDNNNPLSQLCPDGDKDCIDEVKKLYPDLNEECVAALSQMDYYLVGRENLIEPTNEFDEEYNNLINRILESGVWLKNNRTDKLCLTLTGQMCVYDLYSGKFPALTTKKLYMEPMIGELFGFIRGFSSAEQFRNVGCNFWDANANESPHWLSNPNRTGMDDLGRIYGVQSRNWINRHGESVDQLAVVIDKLKNNIDDRRLIVTHWNPGELEEMSLPPCHDLYQFHRRGPILDMSMYQRSNDVALGTPMNIASYALLLLLVAKITGHRAGKFTHFMGDTHIYEDQYDLLTEQIKRNPYAPPTLTINDKITRLEDLETWVTQEDFTLIGYEHHPSIAFPFSV